MESNDRKKLIRSTYESSTLNNEKGIVFISALAILAVLTLLGVVAVTSTTTDIKISSNYKKSKQAFYAAESGVEFKYNQLKTLLNRTTGNSLQLDSIAGLDMEGYTFNDIGTYTPTTTGTMTTGNFTGLTSLGQTYTITSTASLTGTNTAKAQVTLLVDDNLIPLFQFAVFYEDDLEILPGQDMTISGSRIHSNSDIYFAAEASKTLSIDSITSSAGNIFNYRKDYPLSTMTGTVEFKDGSGVYQSMAGLDSTSVSPDWHSESLLRWDGNVKSQEHGINQLNLPLPESNTAIDIIKPGDTLDPAGSSESQELLEGRYYWKAGLRIINGQAYDKDGTIVDLTDGGTNPNPLSNETFYDQREGKDVTITTVDVTKLQTSSNATTALNNAPITGEPGILYIQESAADTGVRLINGDTLDTDPSKLPNGFTVASENPVYVQGDYNVANNPASIAADAITILSNDWNDSNSNTSSKPLSSRIASNSTFNAAIITGHVETTVGSQYSGGLENFPRFLENWSSATLTYSGSLVSLWQSAQATGNWAYGGNVYTAPTRNWSYGIDINNLPPGTPSVRQIQKGEWLSVY